MITTKRLKGSRIPGSVSAEVVFVYDHETKGGHYQMRVDGRTSGARALAVAESEYYAVINNWLEVGASRLIEGMPLGELPEVCYDGDSTEQPEKETTK